MNNPEGASTHPITYHPSSESNKKILLLLNKMKCNNENKESRSYF